MLWSQALGRDLNQTRMEQEEHLGSVAQADDTELVRRARGGDYGAFEELFLRHRDLVYRFAYQMAPRRDDAEDIVQEVFIRAYQNLNRYRDEAKFTTWLLRIAGNLGTDRARMHHRRTDLEHKESAGSLSWMTVGSPENPIDDLESQDKREILRRAIAALPEHHRNVIILRDIQEMDYRDMAELLNCTVGGAKLRVLRARRALRDRLAPIMEELL
ncbi:MAG: sigma-70 family RNA polymerase sigma factor [Fimbriimonadaceae bacterium]|nr:sigma-70 family RNA polymerase sigma factor [Fimbriimonadaceae bacterium]MCG9894288.1 sigma-70 family RNA polymerase sigma factor [Fimbriimonadaceae bacterium]